MSTTIPDPESSSMSLCYFGTYESQYPRNRIFIKGLNELGIQVQECHVALWELNEHKGASFGFSIGFLLKFIFAQLRLLVKFISHPHSDVIIVGYIGHLDIFLAWFLAKVTGARLVFNPLVSLYDTVVADRGFARKSSLKARLFRWLDQTACKLSDHVLLDTEAHINYFRDELNLKDVSFHRVWVGADDQLFRPMGEVKTEKFEILFVGKFIPLHGLPKIIRTAKQLESHRDIHFNIIGDGQLKPEVDDLVKELNVTNISFTSFVPYDELSESMRSADLILGIFGDSEKSKRVIPNKLYQALAVGKAVLSATSQATEELLEDEVTAFLCEAEVDQMVEKILRIKADPAVRISVAEQGHALYKKVLTNRALSETLIRVIG
ncbi:MAG: glycosyltransferase family 4 protein [Candidatus Marinimicrobia bacterium]|nr:glycosyltransferase family 4 protein [Candidatus Neomarinimicrobiota bacterium]MCF7904431.1 glycosyltransferase family 4 protein [Candidatus Neomarinimicrobiota bacterium]